MWIRLFIVLFCLPLSAWADDVLSPVVVMASARVVVAVPIAISPSALSYDAEGGLHLAWFEQPEGVGLVKTMRVTGDPYSSIASV